MRINRLSVRRKKRGKGPNPLSVAIFYMARYRYLRLVLLGGIVVFGLITAWSMNAHHKVDDFFVEVTASYGYRLKDVVIKGRHFSSKDEILQAIAIPGNGPIFKYKPWVIEERLTKGIPWIKSVQVQRILPGQLIIHITERVPIALLQHQKHFYLVDETGQVIGPRVSGFDNLPVIVGKNSPHQAPKLLKLLEQYPQVLKRLTALVHVQNRRFDLMLNGNLTIKLPEVQIEAALSRLNFLLETKKLNLDEVTVVDLRLPKQLIVKVSKAAAQRLKLKTDAV